jgi:Family of unknown function (DUF5996)
MSEKQREAAAETNARDDSSPARTDQWPELTLQKWEGTRNTLHLWTQIVGKVRLALAPMTNHWWQVPLYVSARGLTTSLMHAGGLGLEMQFDFVDQHLDMRTTDGQSRAVALEPCSIAEFHEVTLASLAERGVEVASWFGQSRRSTPCRSTRTPSSGPMTPKRSTVLAGVGAGQQGHEYLPGDG